MQVCLDRHGKVVYMLAQANLAMVEPVLNSIVAEEQLFTCRRVTDQEH